VKKPFLIIGGGLSGLAAAIRYARYSSDVLLLEKHSRIGGLNSYYYRNKILLETGLHAVTNYAPMEQKKAPLNRLLRQLKLSRKDFHIYPQIKSHIAFQGATALTFTNDFNDFCESIKSQFPSSWAGFSELVREIDGTDPFVPGPFRSARKYILSKVRDRLLTDMLLCPLMYYGSSIENDIDFNQFIIMFRSIYQEGMFRPVGTIKDFLDKLKEHYLEMGGKIKLKSEVSTILTEGNKILGVELVDGEVIECDQVISTIGHLETLNLLHADIPQPEERRMGFVETIFLVDRQKAVLPEDRTIIFYNDNQIFEYRKPNDLVDYASGVICFPYNFIGRPVEKYNEVRSTHLAHYHEWEKISGNKESYAYAKEKVAYNSSKILEKYIGSFQQHVIYQDTFTPLTIQKFTAKKEGAIYGSPHKIKDGNIGYANLF